MPGWLLVVIVVIALILVFVVCSRIARVLFLKDGVCQDSCRI